MVSCFSVGSVAGAYDDIYLPRIFIPWARLLLERAALRPGEAVLDIATGPGTVARLVAEQVGPKGHVVGADLSEAMIAIAKAKPAERRLSPLVAEGQVRAQMVSNLVTARKAG